MRPQGDSRRDRIETAAALLLCLAPSAPGNERRDEEAAQMLLDLLLDTMSVREQQETRQLVKRILGEIAAISLL